MIHMRRSTGYPAMSESSAGPESTIAAIDCGTNSLRLLIQRGGETLERPVTVTRLGEGVDRTGRLSDKAIERNLDCLRTYRDLMDRHGVPADRIRVAATSAVRDAANGEAFLDDAEEILGVRPEVLSGVDEGQLSFDGATSELDPDDGAFLVVDIGGGSTELAFGGTSMAWAESLDIGAVRFTEKYLDHDPPKPEELTACISVTELFLDDVARDHPEVEMAKTVIGVAGTFTTAAAVELGLREYSRDAIHHFRLTRSAAEDVFRTLATEAAEDRAANPGLAPDRVDVIVGGMCILVKVMRYLDLEEVLISESDILDGLAASLRV